MAKISRQVGTTSQVVDIFAQNSSLTTGAGLTALAYNTSGLTCYYHRNTASASVSVTLATMTIGTWATGGLILVDDTHMPGVLNFGIPNAALVTGADTVVFYFQGATNLAPIVLEIELTAVNNQSVAFGLTLAKTTNITGFNDIAATAIVSSGAITTSGGKVSEVTLVDTLTTYTGNTVQTGDAYAVVNNGTYGNSALHTQIGSPWQVGTKYGVTLAASDVTGNIAADLQTIKTQAVTCAAGVTVGAFVGNATHAITVDGSGDVTFNNTSIATVTNLTNLPSIPAGWITAAGIASGALVAAVWDGSASGHTTGGTFGGELASAGAIGDPWSTALPGAYGAGTAGFIVGTNLDAAVSSRSTYAGGDTSGTTTLLSRLTSGRATNLDNLDAAVSSRSTYAGTDTPGTTTLLSRITVAPPTAAVIATAVLTDTGDNTTVGSPGKILSQLGGAFTTTSSSIYSTAALANAPTGGTAPTAAQVATAVWEDLLAGGDFGTAGSIGLRLATDIDAAISSRSTYAGTDTPGTTTLLSRITVPPPTAAAIATAVLTDVGDNTTVGSPGKILAQLGGAFTTTSSSIYSTAALANGPTGGTAPTAAQVATAVWTDLLASSDFSTASSVGALVKANTISVVTNPVPLLLTQTLNSARALDSIGDTALTLNDALQCAVAAVTAQIDASSGTSCTFKTASTGTLLRTKALTLISPPITVPDKAT